MKLSIAIVNWNTKDLLKDCLRSIYENTEGLVFEVIVADNASCDGSAEMVKELFPQVKLIENDENVGFARATNQIIRESTGKYILLLNSDTVVLPGAVVRMVEFMESHPDAGAVGGKLLNPDGSFQASFADFPSLLSELLLLTGLGRIVYGKNYPSYPEDAVSEQPVDWVGGAFMMLRRKTLEEIGTLDEDFPMYYEETDLCYRMKKGGWKVYYLPEASVIHFGGRSANRQKKAALWLRRGKLLFFEKHYGAVWTSILRAMLFATDAVKMATHMIWRNRPFASLVGFAGFSVGAFVSVAFLGLPTKGEWWKGLLILTLSAPLAILAWVVETKLISGPTQGEEVARRNAFSFLASLIPLLFVPAYAINPTHPAVAGFTRHFVLLVALLCTITLKFVLLSGRWEALRRWIEGRPRLVLGSFLSIYIVLFLTLAVWKYQIMRYNGLELAQFTQALWNTLHGRFMHFTLIREEGTVYFSQHNAPILLALVPLYALFGVYGLLISVVFSIGLSALPLFLLARGRVGRFPALLVTVSYLLCPYLAISNISDFHELFLLPPILLFCFYFFERGKFKAFLLLVLLALSIREDVALTMMVFSLYSFLRKRSLAWVFVPGAMSLAWLGVSFLVVVPHFSAFGNYTMMKRFAEAGWGDSFSEVVSFAFHNPTAVLKYMLQVKKVGFVYSLFQPTLLLLPLASHEILFVFPWLTLNLLPAVVAVGMKSWNSVTFAPLISLSYSASLGKFARWLSARTGLVRRKAVELLSILVLFSTISTIPLSFRGEGFFPSPQIWAQREAMSLIPPDASVAAPRYMLPVLSERADLERIDKLFLYQWPEYIIIDVQYIEENKRTGNIHPAALEDLEAFVACARRGEDCKGYSYLWGEDGIHVWSVMSDE